MVGAAWELPSDKLPELTEGFDRRGLFLLNTSPVTLRFHVGDDTYINIKRIGFPVAPADSRIDYGSQGESWDAVVGDLARPPQVSLALHWLHIYVILSRARSLEGLLLLRLPSRKDMDTRPPQTLLAEIARLVALESGSAAELHRFLKTLECEIPAYIHALFLPGACEEEKKEVERLRKNQKALEPSAPVTPLRRPRSTLPSSASGSATCEKPLSPSPSALVLATAALEPIHGEKRLRSKTSPAEAKASAKRQKLPPAPCDSVSSESPHAAKIQKVAPARSETMSSRSTQPSPTVAADRCEINVWSALGYSCAQERDASLVDLVRAALRNVGNTCYLNALLHVLARIPTLRTWFQEHLNLFGQSHAGLTCPLCSLARDVNQLCLDVDATPFVPTIVKERALWSRGMFHDNDQHDVTEAIQLLLHSLNAVDERAMTALAVSNGGAWTNGADRENTYTTPLWTGLQLAFVNTMHCATCGATSKKKERLFALPLDLPEYRAKIEDLQENHWGDQPLKSGDTPYRCPNSCAAHAVVTRTVHPTQWPKVLLVTLKRWTHDGAHQLRKISTEVDFETVLNIDMGVKVYHLRGLVEHRGATAGMGHYVSYVRAPDHVWYFCDDGHSPQRVSIKTVLQAQAYVLVYEQ